LSSPIDSLAKLCLHDLGGLCISIEGRSGCVGNRPAADGLGVTGNCHVAVVLQGVQIEDLLTNMPVYAWAIIKITGGGLIAAYVAHFFLPKRKFYKQEFYCADCGEFLGYSITKCPRIECGSNRYTTDAELAHRQSYKWQKKHRR